MNAKAAARPTQLAAMAPLPGMFSSSLSGAWRVTLHRVLLASRTEGGPFDRRQRSLLLSPAPIKPVACAVYTEFHL